MVHVPENDELSVGDLLVGAAAIKAHLVSRGMRKTTDPHYLKRQGWPIGNVTGDFSQLAASRSRLDRHIQKITAGKPAA
jgi:hypothetical protein